MPDACSGLKVVRQSDSGTTIDIEWTKPAKGGKTSTYLILRREKGETKWKLEENSYERKATVKHQTVGKTYEYCVAASNKAGESRKSNIISVRF